MSSEILIEANDLVQRKMSNGGEETFKVIDPGFHESFASIPAHYQMKVHKLGVPEAKKEIQSITYNISGANARVNSHSVDNSINTINIDPNVLVELSKLRDEIKSFVANSNEQTDALDLVDTIELQFASRTPNKSVVKALIAALPSLGNISSIGSFLLTMMKT